MRLKSFQARTVMEAMQMVRDALGEDAIIVSTREENGGKSVRVTAALEHEDHYEEIFAGENRNAGFTEQETAANNEDSDAVIEALTDVMLRHSVPDDITDQVISCATILGLADAGAALTAALEHLYSFRPLPHKADAAALMFVGPPGSGKSLAVAKFAARGVLAGRTVAVISCDTQRAGAAEQLSAFTRLLRIDLQRANDPRELRAELENARGADEIYIDTGGLNPFDPEDMRSLARLISAGSLETVLTLPAGGDADESGEIARMYAALGVRAFLPTRLDIARRFGGLLAAAHSGGLIFADGSHTAKVADGLVTLSPRRLAQLLMPQAFRAVRTDQNTTSRQPARTG